LPVRDWPDSVAVCMKAIKTSQFGTTIVLNDQLAAQCIIREQTGTLKGVAQGVARWQRYSPATSPRRTSEQGPAPERAPEAAALAPAADRHGA
jgi:hypothetical protein